MIHRPNCFILFIDPKTGKIIDTNTRLKQIDSEEKVIFDKETGFKIITQRTINPNTGLESIHEKLIEFSTGKEISSSKGVAFGPDRRKTILELYEETQARKDKAKQFWSEEYPKMSLDERKAFWTLLINRRMRWQSEAGFNMYDIFDKEVYQDWKEKEPEIDNILNYVVENLSLRKEDRERLRRKIVQIRGGD